MKKLIILGALALAGCEGDIERWLDPSFKWSCKKEMASFSASSCSAFDSGSYHSRTCRAFNAGKSYTYTWDTDSKISGSNSNGCRVSSFSFTPLEEPTIYNIYEPEPPRRRYFCTLAEKAFYGSECVS